MHEYLQRSPRFQTSGKTKADKKPLKFIKGLFERFAAIWGEHWCKAIEGREKAAMREWAEALAPFEDSQITKAVQLARVKHPWPLRIAEFIELCNNAENGNLINAVDATDIADKKIKKRFIPKNFNDLQIERAAFADLSLKIFKDQKPTADVAFCKHDGCNKYIIVDYSFTCDWFCKDHELKQ
jgi:hypothetical protein